MSRTKEQIIEDIKAKINNNCRQDITGNKLQRVLINELNDLPTLLEEDAKLATKQDTLVSGENIKTVGGQSLLGEGDVPVDTTVTKDSGNLVTSGAVYTALQNIQPSPSPTPAEVPVLYICDQDKQVTAEEAAHNLVVLDQLVEQVSDYEGQINIPVKLVFRWDDDEETIEYEADGSILMLEKSHGDSDTYYLEIEYKFCDKLLNLERTIQFATDNDEQRDNGRLIYYFPNFLIEDAYVLNHPINIPITILESTEESEGVEVELRDILESTEEVEVELPDISWSEITRTFHIIPYDAVNEYMQRGMMLQYSIGGGVLSYNLGEGTSSAAAGDLYDDVEYYQVYFDFNDKVIRLRVYDNHHVTTMWKSKSSSPTNNNVVIYELWNEKNVSTDVFQSIQSTPTRGEDADEGTILEGDPEHLYHETWFNNYDMDTNNNLLTEAITNFLNGKTVILHDATSNDMYMNVIGAASLCEVVRGGQNSNVIEPWWDKSTAVGLVAINLYNMKKVVWAYLWSPPA